jgi:hypothetical protein
MHEAKRLKEKTCAKKLKGCTIFDKKALIGSFIETHFKRLG